MKLRTKKRKGQYPPYYQALSLAGGRIEAALKAGKLPSVERAYFFLCTIKLKW